MQIVFIHETGKKYKINTDQVVIYADNGKPCAIAYARDGLIVCCDASQADFGKTVDTLKIKDLD